MSCIRLNLTDHDRTISGVVHGSIGDAVIASLSAEPETIHELEFALARFHKATGDWSAIASLRVGENFEPYDAGIMIVDLAAQLVVIDSTYSIPAWVDNRHTRDRPWTGAGSGAEPGFHGNRNSLTTSDHVDESGEGGAREAQRGDSALDQDVPATFEIGYHDGESRTNLRLPYRLADTWLFVGSVPEYEGIQQTRRAERTAQAMDRWFDPRTVLFGKALSQFLATEIRSAPNLEAADLFTQTHAKWLTTPRADLQGRAPREWLLAKKEFIDFDLNSRELQWSFTGECPPPLIPTAHAYRFAGFGTHEIVIYYDLIRLLLEESYEQARQEMVGSIDDETERLEQIKSAWLEAATSDNHGKSPALIIEWERRRIPWAMSGKESIIDEDCPVCQAMAADLETIMFCHLDGCNMDDQFEFSFFMTRQEWEADRRRMEEFNREFEQRWRGREAEAFDDRSVISADGQAPF